MTTFQFARLYQLYCFVVTVLYRTQIHDQIVLHFHFTPNNTKNKTKMRCNSKENSFEAPFVKQTKEDKSRRITMTRTTTR